MLNYVENLQMVFIDISTFRCHLWGVPKFCATPPTLVSVVLNFDILSVLPSVRTYERIFAAIPQPDYGAITVSPV